VALLVVVALIAAPDEAHVGQLATAALDARQDIGDHPGQSPTAAPALAPSWRPPRNTPRVTVSLGPPQPVIGLPRSFLGYSIEVFDVGFDARYLPLLERAFALIRIPGDGPQVLRVGGNSTDQGYWHRALPVGRPPSFAIDHTWLSDLRRIVRPLHLRVILGLNAISGSPAMAAGLARETVGELPARSVIGFEIGNEPDLYSHRFDGARAAAIFRGRTPVQRDAILTADGYANNFGDYAAALRRAVPGIGLAGPAIANPLAGRSWLTQLVARDHQSLGLLTEHRYPLSACFHDPSSPYFPTIGRLLSERSSAGMAASVAPTLALAHRDGLRLRLTEFNSVSCLGRSGVSNTFATALWAPDALFELLRAGVDGVNLHLRTFSINAPFLFTRDGFVARPAVYGLALFARALGPGARLLAVHLRGARLWHLKVWAVLVERHELRLLVLEKGPAPVRMTLALPGSHGPARVERLLAPSVRATRGVTLAGQSLGPDGRWVGRRVTQQLADDPAGYALALPGYSAALVTVRVGSLPREGIPRQGLRDHRGRLGHRPRAGARARRSRGAARAVGHRRRAR
jgi:hypothetical protein